MEIVAFVSTDGTMDKRTVEKVLNSSGALC
jgi:hypothetical protein